MTLGFGLTAGKLVLSGSYRRAVRTTGPMFDAYEVCLKMNIESTERDRRRTSHFARSPVYL